MCIVTEIPIESDHHVPPQAPNVFLCNACIHPCASALRSVTMTTNLVPSEQLLDLPTDVILEFFVRLPPSSVVLSCRLVSPFTSLINTHTQR